MANQNGTGLMVMLFIFVSTILTRLGLFFLLPSKFGQLGVLDYMLLLSLIALLALAFVDEKAVSALAKDYPNFGAVVTAGILGVFAGSAFGVISIGPDSVLGSITTGLTGTEYVTLSQLSEVDPNNKLDQLRLSISEQGFSPKKHFIANMGLNYYIGLSEEFAMATVMVFILVIMGRRLSPGSPMELYDPSSQIALLGRGVIFGSLHIFAYTSVLTVITLATLGYFIPALVGGVLFGALLMWKGLFAAIIGHAVFNQWVLVAGATSLLGAYTLQILLLILILSVIYYIANGKKWA